MKYLIGAGAVLILAWFGLKNTFYNIILSGGEAQMHTAVDYTSVVGWASQPAETPPGAWETPWGVDIFLVYPSPRLNSEHGLMDADTAFSHPSHTRLDEDIRTGLPADAAIYVPKYRARSNANQADSAAAAEAQIADDLRNAFEAYLANTNRGRGIMLVAVGETGAALDPLLTRLNTEELRHRFAGLVHFTPDADEDDQTYADIECSPALEGACYQPVPLTVKRPLSDHLLPNLSKTRGHFSVIDADGTAAAISAQNAQVSTWLDANAPKPAEPLFGFEAIEAAPIYRPNGEALEPETPEP